VGFQEQDAGKRVWINIALPDYYSAPRPRHCNTETGCRCRWAGGFTPKGGRGSGLRRWVVACKDVLITSATLFRWGRLPSIAEIADFGVIA
jgi:hypothetical protein